MKQLRKSFFALLLCVLLIAALLPTAAFAAGKIDTDRNISLTISYKDGAKAIPNARFEVYKVADVDEYAQMTLTSDFEPYKTKVSGLADLENIQNNEEWLAMASTLKGYVLLDELTPAAEGTTDSTGTLTFSLFRAGLYLVIGFPVTTNDRYTYSEIPFMVFLPGADSENNDWLYDVTVAPKFIKEGLTKR